ncbi:hypothetical protein ABEB36_007901 [Hypothenemus hampei]|uniref:N-acetyl-D-glucosamine kinase n=1 Tax=Hypothenemus hampei TaxID=57062 RepID=A0ABD1EW45_HYPHA
MESQEIVGGIEGGATNSTAVLINRQGHLMAVVKGPNTNHFLIGMEECCKRIAELINQAKTIAKIPEDVPIRGVGLSLSGCEVSESNQELVRVLKEKYPQLALDYVIGSDTEGSIAAISSSGGLVCIAGTGSNTLLINPGGEKVQCGGWGYLLGDEGSAWDVSKKAIKYCFHAIDNFHTPPYSTEEVWRLCQDFFKLKNKGEVLHLFYQNFDKSKIASFCEALSGLARDGDKLARYIFSQAGEDLARSIDSVAKRASKELFNTPGGLQVICVGSVWLSWDLLQSGFTTFLQQNSAIDRLSLLRLITEMGVGAALMVSDRLKIDIYRDYSKNYKIFYMYVKSATACTDK